MDFYLIQLDGDGKSSFRKGHFSLTIRSFLGQCPLILIAALLAFWVIPRKENTKDENPRDKFRRIDFAGAFALAVTITSFLLALEVGGQRYPWFSPPVLGLFAAGLVSASLFVIIEKYWALEPIFPLQMFGHKDVIFSYFVFALQIAAQLTVSFSLLPCACDLTRYAAHVLCSFVFSSNSECFHNGCWSTSHACGDWKRIWRSDCWHYHQKVGLRV